MQLYDHLLRFPLFQGMSRDNLAQVVGHTRFGFHKYEPMRWIAKEGDKCSQLSFLLAGTIQSTTFSDDHVYSVVEQVEAPFILRHGDYYYLFVSWDYCCRGTKSNYRVAVGRSKTVDGPYLGPDGTDMRDGGGKLFLEGDKKNFEAAGHCAAYHMDGEDIFICHGYSIAHNGASILIQRPITWTADGWPKLN